MILLFYMQNIIILFVPALKPFVGPSLRIRLVIRILSFTISLYLLLNIEYTFLARGLNKMRPPRSSALFCVCASLRLRLLRVWRAICYTGTHHVGIYLLIGKQIKYS